MPHVPAPEDVEPIARSCAAAFTPARPARRSPPGLELRHVEGQSLHPLHRGTAEAAARLDAGRWGLPDDDLLHAAVLAYASDYSLLEPILRRHNLGWADPRLRVASLDHAMWFHRPVRMGRLAAVCRGHRPHRRSRPRHRSDVSPRRDPGRDRRPGGHDARQGSPERRGHACRCPLSSPVSGLLHPDTGPDRCRSARPVSTRASGVDVHPVSEVRTEVVVGFAVLSGARRPAISRRPQPLGRAPGRLSRFCERPGLAYRLGAASVSYGHEPAVRTAHDPAPPRPARPTGETCARGRSDVAVD